jgi:hypothetical protein
MHESEKRGVLILNGQAMSEDALSRLLGLDKQTLTTTLTALLSSGVASREDGTGAIYSRRMVRDEHLRKVRTEAGSKGGNPTLLNQNKTTPVKQNPTPSSSSSSSSTTTDKEPELTLLSPTAPKKEIRPEEFANVWNRLRGKLPKVERFTESRKKKVKTRMNEGLTLERFAEAVENCTTKPFLRGDNDDGWTATFDWLVENDKNLEKAINNPYGSNKPNGGNHAAVPTGKTDANMAICAELIAEDQYRSRANENGGVQASEAKQDGRATLFLDSGAVGYESVSGGNGYSF